MTEGIGPEDLKIKKIEVPDPEYKSEIPKHVDNQWFPGFPSTTLICGPPGRGKTNLLINLLTNPKMLNKVFDEIYWYGPTIKSDKLYKTIQIRDENVCTEPKKIIADLEKKLKEQTKKVSENPATAPKVLFVFEDITSFFNTVQSKPEFHRCYTQIRHVKGAAISMVHKYHAFNRTNRTSTQHIILFKANQKDIGHLYEEHGPANMSVKDFRRLVNWALKKQDKDEHPFFYVNTTVDDNQQYRRNFDTILELADFDSNREDDSTSQTGPPQTVDSDGRGTTREFERKKNSRRRDNGGGGGERTRKKTRQ